MSSLTSSWSSAKSSCCLSNTLSSKSLYSLIDSRREIRDSEQCNKRTDSCWGCSNIHNYILNPLTLWSLISGCICGIAAVRGYYFLFTVRWLGTISPPTINTVSCQCRFNWYLTVFQSFKFCSPQACSRQFDEEIWWYVLQLNESIISVDWKFVRMKNN